MRTTSQRDHELPDVRAASPRAPVDFDGISSSRNSTYERPYYLAGHWGMPGGSTEIPSAAQGLSRAETPQIRVLETRRFLVVFDDRRGHETLRIEDKASGGAQIEFDGTALGMTIKATSALILKADGLINIEGTTVVINGRVVLPTGSSI